MKIYTDKQLPIHWVIEDDTGRFWIVPATAGGWKNRQPYKLPARWREKRLHQAPDYNFMGLGVESVGQEIKRRRESAGMTQKQLADAVGVSQSQIADVEADRFVPRPETLNKIEKSLAGKNPSHRL